MAERVIINISDGIADVRFNRSDKRNALDGEQFQAIVDAGESLKGNEAYLRWQWIQNLENGNNSVIYVPTEAGLPILESGKRK